MGLNSASNCYFYLVPFHSKAQDPEKSNHTVLGTSDSILTLLSTIFIHYKNQRGHRLVHLKIINMANCTLYTVCPTKMDTHCNRWELNFENETYFNKYCLYNYSKRVYTFFGTLYFKTIKNSK